MKLTKKQEKEIGKIYDTWLHAYLNGDVRTYNYYLDKDYHFIGSTNNEEFLNRKNTTDFFKKTGYQLDGKTDIRNDRKIIGTYGELVFITHLLDAWFLVESQWNFYGRFRFTNVLHETKDGWRFIYQHYSTPDAKAGEEDTIGYAQINAENQQLREAISRRTKELEEKNRDLEIESALEKVRAVAMGMQKPEDLSSIGKTIFYELKSLGFITIRNSEIVINSEGKEALKSYHYSEYGKEEVIEINYQENALVKKWANDLKKASNIFVPVTIRENKMKEWKAYRKKLGYKSDPKMTRAKAVHYYSYSTGLGALSISTWEKISEDQIRILERFRNVFLLSYKRYIDIKIAEAQAREAQIESALERVRAASMAMHSSSDLFNVIQKLTEQLVGLNIYFDHAYFAKLDDRYNSNLWISTPVQSYPADIHAPYFDHSIIRSLRDNPGSELLNQFITKKEKDEFFTRFFQLPEFKNFPESRKKLVLSEKGYCRSGFKIRSIWLTIAKYQLEPFSDEENKIFERFAKVFEQSYTRFLDLQKAEAQAREAQVQLALERVRARTMAMQRSDELPDTSYLLFHQFETLGFKTEYFSIGIINEKEEVGEMYATIRGEKILQKRKISIHEPIAFKKVYTAWKQKKKTLELQIVGDELQAYNVYRNKVIGRKFFPEEINENDKWINICAYFTNGLLSFAGSEVPPPEILPLLERFAKVFDGTYTRFLDLQKAEAQVREAQIEAALERVRSRTMGMQKSTELNEVAAVLFEQIRMLGGNLWGTGFGLCDTNEGEDEFWFANEMGVMPPVVIPHTEDEVHIAMYSAWKNNIDYHKEERGGKDLEAHYRYLNSLPQVNAFFKPIMDAGIQFPQWQQWNAAFFSKGYLLIITMEPYPEPEIFKRFAKVFDQTYTRFLDLQKAEAQAREAQIQLALERVRARTMAMQHSNELHDAAEIMFQQIQALGGPSWGCGYHIWSNDMKTATSWNSGKEGIHTSFTYPTNKDVFLHFYEAAQRGEDFYVEEMGGKELGKHYNYLSTIENLSSIFNEWKVQGIDLPAFQIFHIAYFSQGYLMFITYEPVPEMHDIFKRFGRVFDQTYTRFLDLQKAETQAREAQIEASLERVRSRSMGMQKSEELKEVIQIVFEQLVHLNINAEHAGFVVDYKPKSDWHFWIADKNEIPSKITHPYFESVWANQFNEAKAKGGELFTTHLNFEEKNKFYHELLSYVPGLPEESKQFYLNCPGLAASTAIQENVSLYIENFSGTPYSEEENAILIRFGKVFQQTHTRFLDLQKAEAQAREAQIEAGLERVRARTMAMHSSEDVSAATATMFTELEKLGIENFRGGFTHISTNRTQEVWSVTNLAEGKSIKAAGTFEIDAHPFWQLMYQAWTEKKEFYYYYLVGKEKTDYVRILNTSPNYLSQPIKEFPDVHFQVYFFGEGGVWANSLQPHSEEDKQIMKRFASVFSLTFRRYQDLQKAEAQAREAQIEAALERVRASSLAMHKSEDLRKIVKVVFSQLKSLNFAIDGAAFIGIPEPAGDAMKVWIGDEHAEYPTFFAVPYHDTPPIKDLWLTSNKDSNFLNKTYSKEDKNKWFSFAFEHTDLKTLPADLKDWIINQEYLTQVFAYAKFSGIGIHFHHKREITSDEADIIKRFSKVFEQAYVRFLDLQKAEAQASEAQIEAALERVRSQAMAMRQSTDLLDIVVTMRNEFTRLGHEAHYFWYMRWLPDKYEKAMTSGDGTRIGMIMELPRHMHGDIPLLANWEKSDEPAVVYAMDVEAAINYVDKMVALGDFKLVDHNAPSHDDIRHINGLTFIMARTMHGEIGYSLPGVVPHPPADDIKTLVRFAWVFDLAYRRFEDLKLAEQKNRETEIELALERTRTQSMLMQRSDELDETLRVFHQQVLQLGIPSAFSFLWLPDEEKGRHIFWAVWAEDDSTVFKSKAINYPLNRNEPATAQCLVDWKSKQVVSYQVPAEGVAGYFGTWSELIDGAEHLKPEYFREGLYYVEAFIKYGCFGVLVKNDLAEDEKKILYRFAVEFERTYTRFLDLQKAEAQAREAHIEAALEKVRSRTMAMQKSAELGDVATVLFKELNSLVKDLWTCGFVLCEKDREEDEWWLSTESGFIPAFYLPNVGDATHYNIYQGWLNGEEYHTEQLEGEALQEHYDWLMTIPIAKKIFDDFAAAGFERPVWQKLHCAYFSKGYLCIITRVPCAEEQIFKRFAQVFDLTYTRFLDLQKAETQAREAQIEAVMEKVRGRAMAMQKPAELIEVAQVLRKEMGLLGVEELEGSTIFIHTENSDQAECWFAIKDIRQSAKQMISDHISLDLKQTWVGRQMLDFFLSEEKKVSIPMIGPDRKEWIEYCYKLSPLFANFYGDSIPDRTYHLYRFSHGAIGAASPDEISTESWDLLKRATTVFSLAYTRFSDLQKAEAQTREAMIEAALERVRARALAMQQPEELKDVAQVMRNEMGALGVEELETSSIYIHGDSSENVECWYALQDPKHTKKKMIADHFMLNLDDTWVGREMKKFYLSNKKQISVVMQGENRKEWINYCYQHSPVFSGFYGETIPDRTYHLYKFSHGYIGAAAPGDISAESWKLLSRAASVFSLAYSRFKDLTQARTDLIRLKEEKQRAETALSDLQSTQKQLIQSEKMASLGELTAGIAHEIQNPLNFVNNFSEVNKELLEEIKEAIIKGNYADVLALVSDIMDNEGKINHHGKRADAIVKSMLQHSRTSSGQKELTDINALCDEYLRLAYHGLRAKEKNFNATFETQFDESIPKIMLEPQDIGRVMLNLINNAFYAVNERSKKGETGYEPKVSVTTRLTANSQLLIAIRDNGPGIPDVIKDKIFQPFFTTKPTGQGTGLGLSLAYDIVTKGHGGELAVETEVGEGSAFIIMLPVV